MQNLGLLFPLLPLRHRRAAAKEEEKVEMVRGDEGFGGQIHKREGEAAYIAPARKKCNKKKQRKKRKKIV